MNNESRPKAAPENAGGVESILRLGCPNGCELGHDHDCAAAEPFEPAPTRCTRWCTSVGAEALVAAADKRLGCCPCQLEYFTEMYLVVKAS